METEGIGGRCAVSQNIHPMNYAILNQIRSLYLESGLGERSNVLENHWKSREESTVLRVTVEMVPFGIEPRKRKIAVLSLANQETSDENVANYEVTMLTEQGCFNEKISDHDRSKGWLPLVRDALSKMNRRKDIRESMRRAYR
jgi:hypothetical protein